MYHNGKNIYFTDRSNSSVKFILANLSKCKHLTTEQEYDLWIRIRQGSKRAFNRLVESNMPYAMRIAKQYLPSGVALEDLFQAGCEGLVRAAHKFDASRSYRFISYATWYVENEVHKAAYDYIDHYADSLDAPIYDDDETGATPIDNLVSYPSQSSDWNLRYFDMLNDLKTRAEKRQYGLGRLTTELHQMLCKGYTTSDFARKNHLNEAQMTRLLSILREEAGLPLRQAA